MKGVERVTVSRGRYPDAEQATVRYLEQDDGWYVRTPEDTDFWRFAHPDARERDVVQLINKKWCYRYGDPDEWDDRS